MKPSDTPEFTSVPALGTPDADAFSYAALDAGSAEMLHKTAEQVRRFVRETGRSLLVIGDNLTLAKGLLDHGQFGPWLKAEFGWTERTAQRLMAATKAFGIKNDTVSALGPTAIYALSAPSTPAAVREAIVARIAAGEPMALAEIKTEVKAGREAVRQERAVQGSEKAAWRAGAAVMAPTTKAKQAADLILARMGEERHVLVGLLAGADAKALLAALTKGVAPAVPQDGTPQPKVEIRLDADVR